MAFYNKQLYSFHIIQERMTVIQQKEEEEEESELEFDSDEDSDEDYEDAVMLKPWLKKKPEKTSARLDRYEPSASSDEEAADVSERAPPVEAELEDYMKVTLPRRRLARWCHEPFFDRAVIGCFVRLFIGESEDGKKCYRLCEIVDVDKGTSEYNFPAASSREKPVSMDDFVVTNVFLCCLTCNMQRPSPSLVDIHFETA